MYITIGMTYAIRKKAMIVCSIPLLHSLYSFIIDFTILKLINIAIKYNSSFINVSDLLLNKEYYVDENSFYFSYKGHKEIAKMIIHSI